MKVIKHQTEKNVGYIISESPKTTIDKDTAMFLKNVTNLKIVLKKEKDKELTDEIGCFFREHNVFEFKGFGDGISINEFVLAMEDSAKSPLTTAIGKTSSVVSDPARLKAIVAKGLSNSYYSRVNP